MHKSEIHRYHIQTFGCQMNVHDSRRMEEVLVESGWEATEALEEATLIILNTCSVREKAEQKLLSEVGKLKGHKEKGAWIAVAGCVAQQEGDRLLKKVPHIDLVLGPDNIIELPQLIAELELGGGRKSRTVFDLDEPRFLNAMPRSPEWGGKKEVCSFVTVMKGCDERCTFCIVPTTRGPERYRPKHEIVEEIKGMVAGGVCEVTLLGQTVNSWYEPGSEEKESQFAELLFSIAEEVPDLLRLRYTSPHPRHLTERLMEAHASIPMLARHIHMPVQSGSDRVLKRMLRRYTRELYIERLLSLKSKVPGLTVSTDVIVGFPGETEADFEETLTLIQAVEITALFGFKYSERPGTPALKLPNDVSEEEKDKRLARLFEVAAALQEKQLQKLVGTTTQVLIENVSKTQGPSRSTGQSGFDPNLQRVFSGRSERHEIVHIPFSKTVDPRGKMVEVQIKAANKLSVWAEASHASGFGAWKEPVKKTSTKLPLMGTHSHT